MGTIEKRDHHTIKKRAHAHHTFEARNDEFLAHYHQRSNVESTFSMVKRKFGASVRAKASLAAPLD
jgi:hypothetical protein